MRLLQPRKHLGDYEIITIRFPAWASGRATEYHDLDSTSIPARFTSWLFHRCLGSLLSQYSLLKSNRPSSCLYHLYSPNFPSIGIFDERDHLSRSCSTCNSTRHGALDSLVSYIIWISIEFALGEIFQNQTAPNPPHCSSPQKATDAGIIRAVIVYLWWLNLILQSASVRPDHGEQQPLGSLSHFDRSSLVSFWSSEGVFILSRHNFSACAYIHLLRSCPWRVVDPLDLSRRKICWNSSLVICVA